MRKLATAAVAFGLLAGAGATVLGFLAPWVPYLELINHFRPFLLAGAVVLFAAAVLLRGRRLRWSAATFLAANLVLSLLPLLHAAPRADGEAGPRLRVATFNLWFSQARPLDTLAFLRQTDADVIVLQEAASSGPLVSALSGFYPHVGPCPDNRCEVRLLSKRPFAAAGRLPRSDVNPPLIWARFAHDGLDYEVIGLHLAYPFAPEDQARHVDWLIGHLNARPTPLIVAGDLNLSPFSWKLAKLAVATGLRRHLTLAASWPAHEWVPVFLLDNVLASPAFASVSARTGPRLGSDHLPVVVDVAVAASRRGAVRGAAAPTRDTP